MFDIKDILAGALVFVAYVATLMLHAHSVDILPLQVEDAEAFALCIGLGSFMSFCARGKLRLLFYDK